MKKVVAWLHECVYVHTYMHTYANTHKHTHTNTHTHMCTYINIHIHSHTHINVANTTTYTCLHTHMHVYNNQVAISTRRLCKARLSEVVLRNRHIEESHDGPVHPKDRALQYNLLLLLGDSQLIMQNDQEP